MNKHTAAEAGTAPADSELLSTQLVLCPRMEQFHQLMIQTLIWVCNMSKCAEQECAFANRLSCQLKI